MKLCPTCGRRPSEAMSVGGYGGGVVRLDRCPDPVHDEADLGPEAIELLRTCDQTDATDWWREQYAAFLRRIPGGAPQEGERRG